MGTFGVVAGVVGALGSVLLGILIWQRCTDESARVLKWAILLWPCAGGLFGSISLLLMSLGRSRTLEVIGEWLAGVMVVTFAAHLCLFTAYTLGRLRRRYGRGDEADAG